jgi:hypothetical protein
MGYEWETILMCTEIGTTFWTQCHECEIHPKPTFRGYVRLCRGCVGYVGLGKRYTCAT